MNNQSNKNMKTPKDFKFEMQGDYLAIRDIETNEIAGLWDGKNWTPMQSNKEEKCEHCNGKGYNTQLYGLHGAEDFGGDGFDIAPSIHKVPCKTCNGTGIKPVSPTPDSMEAQPVYIGYEDTKTGVFHRVDPTDSWEKRWKIELETSPLFAYKDEVFKSIDIYNDFDERVRAFISQVRQEAYEQGKKDAIYDLQQEMQDEQDKFMQGFAYKPKNRGISLDTELEK